MGPDDSPELPYSFITAVNSETESWWTRVRVPVPRLAAITVRRRRQPDCGDGAPGLVGLFFGFDGFRNLGPFLGSFVQPGAEGFQMTSLAEGFVGVDEAG